MSNLNLKMSFSFQSFRENVEENVCFHHFCLVCLFIFTHVDDDDYSLNECSKNI